MDFNKFMDLTSEEFASYYLNFKPELKPTSENVEVLDDSATPNDVDWSTKGAVTPVKNQ